MYNQTHNDLIELMALHEEAISEYYSAACERFSNKDLWEYLHKEEVKHAMWLRSIMDNVIDKSIKFTSEGLSFKLFTDSISRISSERQALSDKRRNLSQVFEFAISIESDLLEKNFLDCFTSNSKGIQNTLDELKKDTEDHRRRIEKAFKGYHDQKKKYLEEKKQTAPKNETEARPDIQKLREMKKRQDEITAYIEDDDTEWIEEYKKTISKISEEHAKLKKLSESDKNEITAFEEGKEKITKKIHEEFCETDEDTVDHEACNYIGLHAEYERQLANLYRLFEKIFPNDELWPFMSEEERKHEHWLKDIIRKMKEGTIIFTKPSYDPKIVLKAIINVAEMIHYCREFKIYHSEAYQIAFDQENSILESGFLKKFSSDAPALEKIFGMLLEDTIEHRNWLKRRMEFYNY